MTKTVRYQRGSSVSTSAETSVIVSSESATTSVTVMPQVQEALRRRYPELAQAIRAAIPGICERHIREVRAQFPVAAQFDDAAALDDLPHVLDGFAQVFETKGELAPLAMLGPAHATARDGQQFKLIDVFGEYVLLRRSIAERVVSQLGRPLRGDEAEALQSAIDGLLATTLISFNSLREARVQLETTALGHYVSSLAHDLRNEINGVVLTVQSLEETGADLLRAAQVGDAETYRQVASVVAEAKACRDVMESSIAAMTRVLDAERLRQRPTLQWRDVALQKLLEGTSRSTARLDRHSPSMGAGRAIERIHVSCREDLVVRTDPDLLGSVLINLVGNAVKHAPESAIQLNATLLPTGHCRIAVCDEGPGIPPEKLATLFEKFERASGQHIAGLGLGLFIARRAADLLGARIAVESEVGRGSCFTIELPPAPPSS